MKLDWGIIIRKLKNEATDEDLKQLEIWLTNPENKAQYQKLKKIWDRTGKLQEHYQPNFDEAWGNITAKLDGKHIAKTRFFPGYNWITKVAATLLILVSVVFLIYRYTGFDNTSTSRNWLVFSTTDTTDSMMLADGTMIWLNNQSSIRFPKQFGNERMVELTGEAYFEVAKDSDHPFVVVTDKTLTKVLGTSFYINTKDDNQHITVFSGKVAFSDPLNKETVILVKGERADLLAGKPHKSAHGDPNLLAWKTGLLVFENTPMKQVATTLSTFYQTQIQLSDQLKELNLTASFYRQDAREALEVISITLDINIEKNDVGFILKP